MAQGGKTEGGTTQTKRQGLVPGPRPSLRVREVVREQLHGVGVKVILVMHHVVVRGATRALHAPEHGWGGGGQALGGEVLRGGGLHWGWGWGWC